MLGEALGMLRAACADEATFSASLSLLLLYVTNILERPDKPKCAKVIYRRLYIGNYPEI